MSQSSVESDVKRTETGNLSDSVGAVASRIKEMREILDISSEEMSRKLGVSIELYTEYESGTKDIPIGIIYKAASAMGVDSTLLLIGENARMQSYTVVRNGAGVEIERYPGYSFSSLAINFIGRTMDPMVVTIHADDLPAKLVKHGGQEFNYVIEGSVAVTINGHEFVLNEGDSIYFDPSLPHGQKAVTSIARFLTVINE